MKVYMPEEVHAKWVARDTRCLDDIVARTGRRVFYNPIDHPAYRKTRVARRDSVRLDRMRLLLGSIGPGLCGLDIGCNMGYTSHHLRRQGFCMTGVDCDEDHLAVAEALNATYGLDVKFVHCYFRQFEAQGPFDITVALTVLYHMFYRQQEQSVPEAARMDKIAALQKVDALTRHALLWESGPDPECEIEFIRSNSGLSDYYSLGATHGTGKRRELGVFMRPNTDLSDYLKRRHGMFFTR
jgi:SAM-dependent methyltransferase